MSYTMTGVVTQIVKVHPIPTGMIQTDDLDDGRTT